MPSEPKQTEFDFPDAPRGPPTTAPTRPPQGTPPGTSVCHYCGERMPSSLMDSTPAVADDQRWAMITPYHNFGCTWVTTRGLRLDAERRP